MRLKEPVQWFSETKERFSEDVYLRLKGFKIHSRPSDTEAVWTRDGKLYDHSEAILMMKMLSFNKK